MVPTNPAAANGHFLASIVIIPSYKKQAGIVRISSIKDVVPEVARLCISSKLEMSTFRCSSMYLSRTHIPIVIESFLDSLILHPRS
jgi:hypothetical protein